MAEGTEGINDKMTIGTECLNIPGSVKEKRILHYGKSIVGIEIPTRDLEGFDFNMPVNLVGERIIDVPVDEKPVEGLKRITSIPEKMKIFLKLAKNHGINTDEFLPDEKPKDEKPEGTVIEETFPEFNENVKAWKDTAKKLNLTVSQLKIIKYFSENPDTKWFEFGDIHNGTSLERSALNDAINQLHKRGFTKCGEKAGTYQLTESGHEFISDNETIIAEKPPEVPPQTSPKVPSAEKEPTPSFEQARKDAAPSTPPLYKSKADKVKEHEEKMITEGNIRRPCSKCGKQKVWGKKTLIPNDHICQRCEGKE